jgi:hypothetical protein
VSESAHDIEAKKRARLVRAVVSFVVGAALLVAAVATAYGQERALMDGLRALREAPIWLVALTIALPCANLFVVSVAFWILNNRHGRVRLDEMIALIASAWLLNFLPMRPGMFGRIAYHKKYNGIGIKASARVLAETVALSGIAMAGMGLLALGLLVLGVRSGWVAWTGACAPIVCSLLAWRLAPSQAWRAYAGALAMKQADMALWAVRYWAVFALIGRPLGAMESIAVAAVSQVALLIPLAGNGLGLREWAVGLLALALPTWYATEGETGPGTGLTADLVNRAAEVLVAVPLGLIGIAVVATLARRRSVAVRMEAPHQPVSTTGA